MTRKAEAFLFLPRISLFVLPKSETCIAALDCEEPSDGEKRGEPGEGHGGQAGGSQHLTLAVQRRRGRRGRVVHSARMGEKGWRIRRPTLPRRSAPSAPAPRAGGPQVAGPQLKPKDATRAEWGWAAASEPKGKKSPGKTGGLSSGTPSARHGPSPLGPKFRALGGKFSLSTNSVLNRREKRVPD